MEELQDGSLGMLWRHLRLEMRASHYSWICGFQLASFQGVFNGYCQAWVVSKVATGTPSSSSSRPPFMYVKVPDPMPKMKWLVKYSILTYFVPSVASLFGSKTMMDP